MTEALDHRPDTGPQRVRVKVRKPVHRRRRKQHPVRWLLIGFGLLGLLAFLDVSWAGFTLNRELRAARDSLQSGADQLAAGDLDGAETSFSLAETDAGRARGAADHPSPRLLGFLPVVGDDARAVRAMSRSAVLAAQAGNELVTAARDAGWDGTTVPGFEPGGRIDLDLVNAAEPALAQAATLMGRAREELAPIDVSSLLGPVRDAVSSGRSVVLQRAGQAEKAAALAKLLPGFLGAEGDRRYLLVMMNLSDPRGSGGYPGSYGLLHADGNRIRLEELAPTSTIPDAKRPIDAPDDVVKRYATFGATKTFIATTYSPDFATSAHLMEGIWEAAGRSKVDGVIGADAVWMSYLLEAIGPVDMPPAVPKLGQPIGATWPDSIAANNVVEVMDRDTFLTTEITQNDDWQSTLGNAVWQAALTRPWPPAGMGSAIARAVNERHFQVYANEESEEGFLGELGATGVPRFGSDPPLVTFNGISPSRVGYFVERSVTSTRTANDDGSQTVTTTITLKNSAPTSPPSILLGSKSDNFPVGTFAVQIATYVPSDASGIKAEIDGNETFPQVQQELDRKAVLVVLDVAAGKTTSATVTYKTGS